MDPINLEVKVNGKPYEGGPIPPGCHLSFVAKRRGQRENVLTGEVTWYHSKDGEEIAPQVFAKRYSQNISGGHTQTDNHASIGPLKTDVRGVVGMRVVAHGSSEFLYNGNLVQEVRWSFPISEDAPEDVPDSAPVTRGEVEDIVNNFVTSASSEIVEEIRKLGTKIDELGNVQ